MLLLLHISILCTNPCFALFALPNPQLAHVHSGLLCKVRIHATQNVQIHALCVQHSIYLHLYHYFKQGAQIHRGLLCKVRIHATQNVQIHALCVQHSIYFHLYNYFKQGTISVALSVFFGEYHLFFLLLFLLSQA